MRTTEVLARCFELEDQMAQAGWDIGVGVWAMHDEAHDGREGLSVCKLGGPDYVDAHPAEITAHLPPPPGPCWIALAVGYEGYVTPEPGGERIETRFMLAAIRDHGYVLITRYRDGRPKGYILDEHRVLTYDGDAVCDIAHNLRHLMPPTPVQGDMPDLGLGLGQLLQAMGFQVMRFDIGGFDG